MFGHPPGLALCFKYGKGHAPAVGPMLIMVRATPACGGYHLVAGRGIVVCRRRALRAPLIAHGAAAAAAVKGGSAGERCECALDRNAAAQAIGRARSNL